MLGVRICRETTAAACQPCTERGEDMIKTLIVAAASSKAEPSSFRTARREGSATAA